MTKNVWVQPQTVVQQFVANEAVSACGDSGTTYYFDCNAGVKDTWYDVVTDNGDNLTPDGFLSRGYYSPCDEDHIAESSDEFIYGWLHHTDGRDSEIGWVEKERVIIWTNGGTDVHCTTKLNMDDWETAKS